MFWLSCLVILKTALNQQYVPQSYALVMDNSTVEGFQIIGEPPDHLNLSYLGLTAVSKNAFTNVTNLKTLNLANNRLTRIPSLSYLPNLEKLFLENNNIKSGKFYVGLRKLEVLNIAGNPLKFFEPGHFFGLPKFASLWTQGLNLSYISTLMFEHSETGEDDRRSISNSKPDVILDNLPISWSRRENKIDVKVCIRRGRLTSVEELDDSSQLPKGCSRIRVDSLELILTDMGIETFEKGWYQLQDQEVISIVLSYNEISEFSKELLNDLPPAIRKINLSGNKIKILRKGIIENTNYIDSLDLTYNSLIDIEYGALEKLNLIGELLLARNDLNNTRFLDSLPPHIEHVSMNQNSITEISSGDFTKFTQFRRLGLSDNEIKKLKGFELRGFSSLNQLLLQSNQLQSIELGAFKDLGNLRSLDLSDNNISTLKGGIFAGLDKLTFISLYGNKIRDQLWRLLVKMPSSLEKLLLGANNIGAESAMTLLSRPRTKLPSTCHQISMNMTSSYNFPHLKILNLDNNSMIDIDGALFKGFENLRVLSLAKNKIKTIGKGLARNLSNIDTFDLSENPITMLPNGSLFGLAKNSRTRVLVNRVPLEVIEAGLFDDV